VWLCLEETEPVHLEAADQEQVVDEVWEEARVLVAEWVEIGRDPDLVESAFASAVEHVYPTK
jgi:hypothetical protein